MKPLNNDLQLGSVLKQNIFYDKLIFCSFVRYYYGLTFLPEETLKTHTIDPKFNRWMTSFDHV